MNKVSRLLSNVVIAAGVCGWCANVVWCSESPDAAAMPADANVLFDGRDFSQWIGEDGNSVKWQIVDLSAEADGAMRVVPGSGSIVTRRSFENFWLHVEFNIPESPSGAEEQAKGNSGIYIQKRYEVQILDSFGEKPLIDGCGALYKTKAPDKNACKKSGEWQTFDIFFRAPRWKDGKKLANARITVLHNGVVIHNNVDIPDKTGLGQPEGPKPGPIKLQDHGAAVQFRNIWIVPLTE